MVMDDITEEKCAEEEARTRHAGRQRGGRGHRHARTPALLPALFAAGYRYEEMLSATWTNVNKHLVNARACVRALERAP